MGLGEGVYYASGDYAGFVRRLIGLAIDLGVIALVAVGLYQVIITGNRLRGDELGKVILWTLAFAYVYLAIIKPSPLRSLGYRLTDTRVVNLRGQTPSLVRMTFRLLLWGFGPFNVVYDLIWMGMNENRQCLRDVFAGTYVIMARAEPAGRGNIHLDRYFAFGFVLVYPKVIRVPSAFSASPDRKHEP